MTAWDRVPAQRRASDADRERAIELLRDGSVDGRLSHDTFVRRLDLALRARGSAELAELLGDLHRPPRPVEVLLRWVAWFSSFTAHLQAAWREPRLPRLAFPPDDRSVCLIGRGEDCDLILEDSTVSRHHAELRRVGENWLLVDLGSTNGTFVNGWRVVAGDVIRPGDWVAFGLSGFRLVDHVSRLRRHVVRL